MNSFTTSTIDCSPSRTLRRQWGSRGDQTSIWLVAALCILWPSLAEMKGRNSYLEHTTLPPSHEVLPWANSVLGTRVTLRENEKECVWEWDREGGASKGCPGGVRGGGGWERRRSNSLTFLGNRTEGKSETMKYRGKDEVEKHGKRIKMT